MEHWQVSVIFMYIIGMITANQMGSALVIGLREKGGFDDSASIDSDEE